MDIVCIETLVNGNKQLGFEHEICLMVRSAGLCVCGIQNGLTHSKPCGINPEGIAMFYTNSNVANADVKSR